MCARTATNGSKARSVRRQLQHPVFYRKWAGFVWLGAILPMWQSSNASVWGIQVCGIDENQRLYCPCPGFCEDPFITIPSAASIFIDGRHFDYTLSAVRCRRRKSCSWALRRWIVSWALRSTSRAILTPAGYQWQAPLCFSSHFLFCNPSMSFSLICSSLSPYVLPPLIFSACRLYSSNSGDRVAC